MCCLASCSFAPVLPLGLVNAFSNFTPTEPSARLSKTFGEVQAFKRQVVKAETLLKAFAKTTDGAMMPICCHVSAIIIVA